MFSSSRQGIAYHRRSTFQIAFRLARPAGKRKHVPFLAGGSILQGELRFSAGAAHLRLSAGGCPSGARPPAAFPISKRGFYCALRRGASNAPRGRLSAVSFCVWDFGVCLRTGRPAASASRLHIELCFNPPAGHKRPSAARRQGQSARHTSLMFLYAEPAKRKCRPNRRGS